MAPSKEVAAIGSNEIVAISYEQSIKASKALLAHIKKAAKESAGKPSAKKNLLVEDDQDDTADTPVWLTLTTKRHIADKSKLQPGKIVMPHPLHADDESLSICLITADPQRAYKEIVASDEFPADLRKRIGRVIDVTKLKAKFSQYEAQRKLFSEHDVFLGDERIINRLPKILGKSFYKTTTKRPVPVDLRAKVPKVNGKRGKRPKKTGENDVNAGTPAQIAKEVKKAVGAALVSLGPSTNTAVRVGYASWTAEQIAANVQAVAAALVEKWVPQKWRNVRGIYLKGPETAALPIWLTDELWVDDKDVAADTEETKANTSKKRKALVGEEPAAGSPAAKKKKATADKHKPASDDAKLNEQIAERKSKLRSAKAKASKAMD
ncbi:ribosomal protein L1 [Cordyceps militaris CM01]|uniref:Ribosomal protein L1 n=1 Tax=Cordyceps militaris (strain CM01) TaxID=983644 RepID=G3JSD7_CORMM|nr:ribosomal protein L1 [Cordyceps militaris CM01]EGX88729.1 ribosomal protein L1 [Cordyceps militaris CM01]